MGIQDRDWYREEYERKRRAAEAESQARSRPQRRQREIPVDLLDNASPPPLWGADWHWSLKLLVWLCIAVLMLIAWRLVR